MAVEHGLTTEEGGGQGRRVEVKGGSASLRDGDDWRLKRVGRNGGGERRRTS